MAEDLITLQEAARQLGGARVKTVVRKLAEAGIRGIKVGRRRLLRPAQLEELKAWLEARTPALTAEYMPAPPMVGNVARRIHRAETRRLVQGVRRGPGNHTVVALDLERVSRGK